MILNFNGLQWLKTCLPSVVLSSYRNLHIYLVDNGSTDGSLEFVESNYPDIRVVNFAANLGFAEAYNRAIRDVQADYVILLNNDTVVLNPQWIDSLVKRAEGDPSIAVVGCKLVTMENHQRLDSVGVMGIRYWRGFVDIGKYEIDRGQYDHPPVVPFSACGAAMLIRRISFQHVSGFDSKLFAYNEDLDLCWRFRLLGNQIAYEPLASVAHYFSGTRRRKGVDPQKLYFSHRNVLRAILKNCGSSLCRALRTYILFSFIVAAGFCVLEPRKTIAIVRGLAWNLLNFHDTYALRLRIQASRTSSEAGMMTMMYPTLKRYEPAEHARLRRILTTLFEYAKLPES